MWFMFGIVTPIILSIIFIYSKINRSWDGAVVSTPQGPYEFKFGSDKQHEIITFSIAIAGVPTFNFELKRETEKDRFFKAIGLSNEHQIGHDEFDYHIYVISDNAYLRELMANNPAVATAVLELFKPRATLCRQTEKICNHAGRIWVEYSVTEGFKQEYIKATALETMTHMKTVVAALQMAEPACLKFWKDPFWVKSSLLMGISSALVINGWIQFERFLMGDIPYIIDQATFRIDAIIWGLGLALSLMVLCVVLLRGSSRAHLVLLELLVMGSLGSVLTVGAEMRDINMEFDRAPAELFEAKTYKKWTEKIRRHKGGSYTVYYLGTSDWRSGQGKTHVSVDSNLYKKIRVGESIVIAEKPGLLHYRWVESIEKKE